MNVVFGLCEKFESICVAATRGKAWISRNEFLSVSCGAGVMRNLKSGDENLRATKLSENFLSIFKFQLSPWLTPDQIRIFVAGEVKTKDLRLENFDIFFARRGFEDSV